MSWISVVIILIHSGLIFASGIPYASKRNEKRVVLVGSGPLPQYLLQSGYEILPIYDGLRNLNILRARKRMDETKSRNPKRIFSGKTAPYASVSRKKNIRRKSDAPAVSRPLNLQNRLTASFPAGKTTAITLKPIPIKDGKVGIPIITPNEIVIRSPQINVKSNESPSSFSPSSPATNAKKSLIITSKPQNDVKTSTFPPTKLVPPSSTPPFKNADKNSFVPSQRYQLEAGVSQSDRKDLQLLNSFKNNQQILKQLQLLPNANTGVSVEATAQPYKISTLTVFPLSDQRDPQMINNAKNNPQMVNKAKNNQQMANKAKNNQQMVNKAKNNPQVMKQLSSRPIETGIKSSSTASNTISTDSPSDFSNDFVNVAAPLTVVYKKPTIEILKSSQEVYQNAEPYAYGYETGDGFGTTQYRQESTKGDGIVKGNYGYKDYKGLFRQVNYIADKGGFHAVVKSNEPGIGYADSADVKVLADYSPS